MNTVGCNQFKGALKPGKQAIKACDSALINATNTRTLQCSIDLDSFMKHNGFPNSNRWDYLLQKNDSTVHAIEVHPTGSGQVETMIRKKESAITQLRSNPNWSAIVEKIVAWHWVATQHSKVVPTDRIYLALNKAGIKSPQKKINL